MSPPRRPKGEKPSVTIRWQRRQMATMEARIMALVSDLSSKNVMIVELEHRLSDMPKQLTAMHAMAAELDDANATIDRLSVENRLAYLEGYHAKSQEARLQQTPILPTGGTFPRNQPQTYAGTSPRNSQGLQDGRQAAESAGFDPGAARFGETAGDQTPGERTDYYSHPRERSVEHAEVARDGTIKWPAWR